MRTRKLSLWIVGAALSALATGCLSLADDEGPILSIELLLGCAAGQQRASSARPATRPACAWMEWTLYRIEDGEPHRGRLATPSAAPICSR